jgi:ANTAR domain
MPTDPLLITHDARREADLLQRTALIEQAKGALMLRYGVDSHQAFAVLVRWARVTRAPVRTIAHALLHGICEGSSQTEVRQRPLIRWLEAQLRAGDPDLAPLPPTPVRPRTGT